MGKKPLQITMKKNIENKIRFNIILISSIVVLICVGMIFYIYNFRGNIEVQKKNIDKYNKILALTNELIYNVHKAQNAVTFYVSSQNRGYLTEFREISSNLDSIIDTLLGISGDPFMNNNIMAIGSLLDKNRLIIADLDRNLRGENPFDSITQKLQRYEPVDFRDSILLVTTYQDTTMQTAPKKNFWKRLQNLFAPNKSIDTLLTVSTLKYDTLKIPVTDSLQIISDVRNVSEQASRTYTDQMSGIKKQINQLIFSDQEISSQLSTLLLALHRETLQSIMREVEKSENIVQKNYHLLLLGMFVAFVLVFLFVILIFNDLNRGYRARKELEEANNLTRKLMEERHKLLLSVSHDIKAPLTSILGYVDLWHHNPEIVNQLEGISSVENSGRYILTLLENLLEFSRLEQGKLKVTESNFYLKKMCDDIAEMFIPIAAHRNLRFEYEPKIDDTLILRNDKIKIQQILANLLSNAVKYTVEGKIGFRVVHHKDFIYFVITDTGTGIPADHMKQLFKPFSRIDRNSALAKGSGFGLFVVKGLVEMLKGEISVISEEGKGTQIEVRIPALLASEADPGQQEAAMENFVLTKDKGKIVVVDDDEALLVMVREMLYRLGCETELCFTLAQFEEVATHLDEYDAVITDMEIGAVTGMDILKKIRQLNADIPVFLMTARSELTKEQTRDYGFTDYLPKPFSLTKLSLLLGLAKKASVPGGPLYNLNSLREIMDGDMEAVRQILQVFTDSTMENIGSIRASLEKKDLKSIQQIAHKMLPMFTQLHIHEAIPVLTKMDRMRECSVEEYPDWEQDTEHLIVLAENVITVIKDKEPDIKN